MENSIFRKKSIDRISSPEELNDYIHVTRPGIWVILGAVVVLLLGMCIWGIFGRLEGNVKTCLVSTSNSTYCYIAEKDAESCVEGMEVRVGSFKGTLGKISKEASVLDSRYPKEMMEMGEFNYDDVVYKAAVDITVPLGVYSASITVDSVSPLMFVFN